MREQYHRTSRDSVPRIGKTDTHSLEVVEREFGRRYTWMPDFRF
jgi:hypothetical protein